MFDIHRHLAPREMGGIRVRQNVCVISRNSEENLDCFAAARTHGVPCALFAAPDASDWANVCDLVSRRQVLAYWHCELLALSKCHLVAPLLNACQSAGLPLIVHLSRHDEVRYACDEAGGWLYYLRDQWPEVPLIVSHLGGENALEVFRTMKSDPRILVDLSCWQETAKRAGFGSSSELLDELVSTAHITQLLFGSDSGWPGGDSCNSDLIPILCKRILNFDVPQHLEANAVRVLRHLKPQ